MIRRSFQASSDPDEYDLSKKAKNKAKAVKAARIKAIRDARDQRRKNRRTSSDEDPDFNPQRKLRGQGRKRKGTVLTSAQFLFSNSGH